VNEQGFVTACNVLREDCQFLERGVRSMTPAVSDLPDAEIPETNAHRMLAVRHLEDARMRLGKAIQYAAGGGVSCYDASARQGTGKERR